MEHKPSALMAAVVTDHAVQMINVHVTVVRMETLLGKELIVQNVPAPSKYILYMQGLLGFVMSLRSACMFLGMF